MLPLGILEEFLVGLTLNLCLLHLTILCLLALPNVTVKTVQLIDLLHDLHFVILLSPKVRLALLNLIIGEFFDHLGRHPTTAWFTTTRDST